MDALLFALTVLGVSAGALVAWRWWLTERALERRERVAVDQSKLDAMPSRLASLEQRVEAMEWRAKK